MTHNFTTNSTQPLVWKGGAGQVAAQGDFGGGTLSLKFSLDNGTTWTLLEDDPVSQLTAPGSFGFSSMKAGDPTYQLQLELTGASSPNLNVRVGDHL